LAFLHQYGHPWDETVCEKAAANGHLDCFKYLHENGCPWNTYLYITGRRNCVEFAFEQGLEWGKYTPDHVADYGNLEILKYLVEKGCVVVFTRPTLLQVQAVLTVYRIY